MNKKKNQNRKNVLAMKSAAEALKFQTHFGLKGMGCEVGDNYHGLAEVELSFIAELGLTQDILEIKKLIDGIRTNLQVDPTPEKGDFCTSITAIALKIASIPNLDEMLMPISWEEQMNKKILAVYFPESKRNEVADWAKSNGYKTSTYLGCPIVKFSKLYIKIERTRS